MRKRLERPRRRLVLVLLKAERRTEYRKRYVTNIGEAGLCTVSIFHTGGLFSGRRVV